MGWFDGRFRFGKKSAKLRPQKEKHSVPYARRASSGWKVLDAQMLLDHWFKSNGIR